MQILQQWRHPTLDTGVHTMTDAVEIVAKLQEF